MLRPTRLRRLENELAMAYPHTRITRTPLHDETCLNLINVFVDGAFACSVDTSTSPILAMSTVRALLISIELFIDARQEQPVLNWCCSGMELTQSPCVLS